MRNDTRSKVARVLRSVLAAALLAAALSGGAHAGDGLLPAGFFDRLPEVGNDQAAITADQLTYNADTHEVIAVGHVELGYNGYQMIGDRLVFDQRQHTARFSGDVIIHNPSGEVYTATDLQLTSAMHQALMRQLTIATTDGALITAGDGDFRRGDETVLNDATYSPCGKCIDAKGRRIGWTAKMTRVIYHGKSETVTLEQPSLYLLGIPVAWLPWLSMPDPTKRMSHFLLPSADYSKQFGARVNAPYFVAVGRDTDLIFTPSLMSRQGGMLDTEFDQRFVNGAVQVRASAVYQLDPSAFAGTVGDRPWRGALQTSGEFRPVAEWTVGWSYTTFTDAAYLTDYHYVAYTNKGLVNQVYATHLARDEFIDFRLQQFNLLGNVTTAAQDQQAMALPNARYRNVIWLPNDSGEIDLSATLLGVKRGADQTAGPINGVPYTFGYQEAKAHGTVEAGWQKQYILAGLAITPYVGLRADAAYYDGSSALKPGQIDLFNATPIAAIDVRYPMIGHDGTATHLIEPIAQLVYRASDVTNLGITNDNAQSFVFDDSNLFSYNRFTGTDRQETGLRANIGANYQLNFANGSWLDVMGGESFQLAGANAFAAGDGTQATTGAGLSSSPSYLVLGVKGSPFTGLNLGSKFQYDPAATRLTRAGVSASYDIAGTDFTMDYLYIAKNAARGVLADQQEIRAGASVPFADYWRASAHVGWDLAASQWLVAGAGLHYSDGYLGYGADVEATGPTNTNPTDLRFTASLNLKGLGGLTY